MFDDNIEEFKEWLADNELQVRDTKEYGNGYLINLKQCPFSNEHTDGAYIFFKPKHIVARCHQIREYRKVKILEIRTYH